MARRKHTETACVCVIYVCGAAGVACLRWHFPAGMTGAGLADSTATRQDNNDGDMNSDSLSRVRMLIGGDAVERISGARVIIFGVGGVGSWCAECLVRTGVAHLTVVDGDCVCASNINRQLMATTLTLGERKVEALRRRLLEISPAAEIEACFGRFTSATAGSFRLGDYDCIVDAIDSLPDKMLLVEEACRTRAFFVSSMGAALKADPSRVQVAEFGKVHGCPLARALRHSFRKAGHWPERPFSCVFSDELLRNEEQAEPRANGSLMHVTAIFGLTLAGLVIRELACGLPFNGFGGGANGGGCRGEKDV